MIDAHEPIDTDSSPVLYRGLFCGFLAGCVVFSLVAGIYASFPLSMRLWEATTWGVGLAILMQITALFRRLYVYI